TRDLLITSQLLYLLSYASDAKNAPIKRAGNFPRDHGLCQQLFGHRPVFSHQTAPIPGGMRGIMRQNPFQVKAVRQ
ncbi:MAG TPA: hypothetical protein PKK50_11590, partial [Myxococcota bacterium]|nr:hypothetical protein [Myxococcota bacterium]